MCSLGITQLWLAVVVSALMSHGGEAAQLVQSQAQHRVPHANAVSCAQAKGFANEGTCRQRSCAKEEGFADDGALQLGLQQAVSGRREQVRTCLVGERGSTGMAKLSPACRLAPLLISAHISPQYLLKT